MSSNYFDGQARSVFQGRDVYGGVHFHPPGREEPPGLRVAAPPVHYRNNESQLERLGEILEAAAGRVAVAVVVGAPGSGRSTLCETWLHGNLGLFDRFYSVRVGHRPVADVLAELLSMLGYRVDEMPASVDGRAAMWQQRTAEFKVALLVDDVVSAADVVPLLPTCAGSYVLVVGSGLTALRTRYSAEEVALEPLKPEAALGVLSALVGEERLAAEAAERDELIRICAGSAAELTVAGALLAEDEEQSVRRLVRRIRAKGALTSAVFDVAYERLTEHAQAAYRFFGAHPGDGDVRPEVVGAVLGLDEYDVEDALRALKRARLVDVVGGRYRMSELARIHAAALGGELAASVIEHYAVQGLRIAECALPTGWPGKIWDGFASADLGKEEARQWLFAEQANLAAAAEAGFLAGAYEDVIRLARALWPIYKDGAYPVELAAVSQDAVQAAQAAGMPLAEGLVRTQLVFARLQRREWAAAHEQLVAVAELASTTEERASAEEALGLACFEPGLLARQQGRLEEAAELYARAETHLRRSFELAEKTDNRRRHALIRLHLAKVVVPEEAAVLLAEAWPELSKEPDNAVKVRLWQGRKLIEAGAFEEGATLLADLDADAEALNMHRERIAALQSRAEAALARGYRDQAKAHAQDALDIARNRGYTNEATDLLLWLERL